jgi:alpha-tubulin suppressor-like RCC1 family protein
MECYARRPSVVSVPESGNRLPKSRTRIRNKGARDRVSRVRDVGARLAERRAVKAITSLVALAVIVAGCASRPSELAPDGGTVSNNPCGGNNLAMCGASCVDVAGDYQNCGACGKVCPADQVCSHGACAVVCGGGSTRFGNRCVDLKANPAACGNCTTQCSDGQVCNVGSCALTCQQGLTDCSGGCVDTSSDDRNCATCGHACPSGAQCVSGTCQATCQSGWSSCPDGHGGSTCVDTTNDPSNCNGCGNACPTGYFCSAGVCGLQCGGGTTLCNSACVDENIDPNNCGGCGSACGTDTVCSAAHCCSAATPYYCGGCDTFANCVQKTTGHIAAGSYSTCAITASGGVSCWGENSSGQVGNGSTKTASTAQASTSLSSGITSVAAGSTHACAITSSGQAWCWGNDYYAQLGDGNSKTNQTSPVAVSGITTTGSAAAGSVYSSCFLLASGEIDCAGWEYFGELANGATIHTNASVSTAAASKITNAVALSGGLGEMLCAVLDSGGVQCWGSNADGLGDGSSTLSSTPVSVSGVSTAIGVAAGSVHACVILQGGTLQCWGYNVWGQLGDGTTTSSSKPVTASISNVVAVAVGGEHTCVVTTSGAVECIGYNYYGQLGNGATSKTATTTWQTAVGSGAVGVACGASHTCALMSNGQTQCWGYNAYGQLGDGTTTNRSSPVLVSGF